MVGGKYDYETKQNRQRALSTALRSHGRLVCRVQDKCKPGEDLREEAERYDIRKKRGALYY